VGILKYLTYRFGAVSNLRFTLC